MKVITTEMFNSIQGEGIHVGEPSFFVRFPGCNLSCPGFGMPRGTEAIVAPPGENVTSFKDLQVPHAGCDSAPSWDARFSKMWQSHEVEELALKIKRDSGNSRHVVFTGGEPLLPGTQRKIAAILGLSRSVFSHVTFETNGTQELGSELAKELEHYDVTFSVSPKLGISGESIDVACRPDAVKTYGPYADFVLLKFVVRNTDCLGEVEAFLIRYDMAKAQYDRVSLMPEGATIEGLGLTAKKVADICLDKGFRYSPRLHVDLYGNTFGT